MNKKLIAIAVAAGMAAPMAANAAPTVYGQLQAELSSFDNGTGTADQDTIDDNKRGRLGLKGSEDLGGGLKAIYKFEWQVTTDTGDVNDGARNSLVGLQGNFGTVEAGRLKSPYKYYGGVKYDAFVATNLEARNNNGGMLRDTGAMSAQFGSHSFLSNSISYKNKFNNVELWVTYQLGEDATTTTDSSDNLVAGVKADLGAFEVFAAMADEDNVGDRTKFGGAWKAGPHKVMAQFETQDDEAANGALASNGETADDHDAMYAAYNFTMGKNTLVAQYGQVEFDRTGAGDIDYTALGVIHKMSKTTRVFAGYRTTEVDGSPSEDQDVLSLGMRVDF